MSEQPQTSENWTPCAPGTLEQFAGQEKTRQRRRFLMKASGVAIAVGCGGSVGLRALSPLFESEPKLNGLVCADFRSNAQAMLAETLPANMLDLMRGHLSRCEACQDYMRDFGGNKHG